MNGSPIIELHHAEWCPYSHRVRMRLTDLELDWISRAVAPDKESRSRLQELADMTTIPTLVYGPEVISGSPDILAWLDEYALRNDIVDHAESHRAKAATEGWLQRAWPPRDNSEGAAHATAVNADRTQA